MTDGNQAPEELIKSESDSEEFGSVASAAGNAATEISIAAEKLIEKMAASPIETMEGLTDEQRTILIEQRTEMLSLIEQSAVALVNIDQQFSNIAEKVDTWLAAHNSLVTSLNNTVLNPRYMYSAVTEVVNKIEDTRAMNNEVNDLHDKLQLVSGTKNDEFTDESVLPGQYVVSFSYPDNIESLTLDEVDAASANVVRGRDPATGDLVEITKENSPVLFAALCLRMANYFTDAVAKGIIESKETTTKDGKPYTMMDHTFVFEITSASTADIPE